MVCSLCGEHCTCSFAGRASSGSHTAVLIDPDQYDTSEQFAASLENLSAASEPLPARAYARVMLQSTAPALTQPEMQRDWRNEVFSRVKAHRARRGYEEESLPLGFGEEPSFVSEAPVASAALVEEKPLAEVLAEMAHESAETASVSSSVVEPAITEPITRTAKVRRPRGEGNVIEFPKSQNLFENELAEPVSSVPRILEAEPVVEEPSVPVSQPLATITLDEEATNWQRAYLEPYPDSEIELPLQVAPLAPRIACLMIDGVLVLAASAIFAFVVITMTHYMPQGKTALAAALVLPTVFWAAYQFLFMTFCGTTPGMQMSQLEMCDFEGYFPAKRTRQARAAALLLSCVSCGMGFAWSLVDEDSLGWHDRITRTYLRLS